MEVVKEVYGPGITDVDFLLAGAQDEGLEDVTLSGARLAGDDDVVPAFDEAETGEFEDESAIDLGLEGPVKRLQIFPSVESAHLDAPLDDAFALASGRLTENTLEQGEAIRMFRVGPSQVVRHVLPGFVQLQAIEVRVESLEEIVGRGLYSFSGVTFVSDGLAFFPSWSPGVVSLGGHVVSPCDRGRSQQGRVSYSVRSPS